MKRSLGLPAILALAAVLAIGLYFLVQRGTEGGVAVAIEKAITDAGGSFEDISYRAGANTVLISGLVLPTEGEDEGEIRIGQLRLVDPDPEGWRRAFAPPKPGDPGGAVRLFAALDLEEVSLSNERGRTEFAGLMAREASMALREMPNAQAGIALDAFVTGSLREELAKAALRLSLNGLTLTDARLAPASAEPLLVDELKLVSYEAGRIDTVEIGGLRSEGRTAEGEPQTLTIGRITSRALDVSGLVRAIGENHLPGAGEPMPLVPVWAPQFEELRAEGLTATGSAGTIDIAGLTLTDTRYLGAIAVGGRLDLTGLRVPVDATGTDGSATQLAALGYETLLIDLGYRLAYDDSTAISRIEDFSLSGAEMGTLSLAAEFGNVTFYRDIVGLTVQDLVEGGQLTRILQGVRLNGLTLTYADDSLVRRLLAEGAEDAGEPLEAYVRNYATELRTAARDYTADPFLQRAHEAAADYIEAPGSVTLELAPETPPSLAEIAAIVTLAPLMAARVLNLSIETQLDENDRIVPAQDMAQ
ncbi:MAG: hypothetical protein HXY25_03865 [Alphaproteobacteria bacterium]|nr:hypothetical protein [Alphaproteobacteria bacterium]